jgi:hypothetical protein
MLFTYQESTHSHSVRVNLSEESSCCLDPSLLVTGQPLCERRPIVMDMNSLIVNSLLANQII